MKAMTEPRIIPLIDRVLIGEDSPLTIFEKLTESRPGSFLLESAAQGVWSRYSFIGVNSRGQLVKDQSGKTSWLSKDGKSAFPFAYQPELASTALEALQQIIESWNTDPSDGLPPLLSGLVGVLGWDLIREIENLPNAPESDFVAPLMSMNMFSDLAIIDHHSGELILVANMFRVDGADMNALHNDAASRIEVMKADLAKPVISKYLNKDGAIESELKYRVTKDEFFAAVERAKDYVRAGDVFQVVISQRFDIEIEATPLEMYRALRALNPSPYMYLLNFEDEQGSYAVVGSSPEALVTVSEGTAIMHPIAGSRPRGSNVTEDEEHAHSLIEDSKERAEHLMLVDLVRNDLLKSCESDSVQVTEFMQIHRYSHIMHLVSTVEGKLRADKNVVDVFKATFPAGTLSGAPKPRALEIIDELEVANRGIYGGVVGYFDFAGNADLAIAIRTAFIRDSIARVQAGAGIVLDSVAENEYQETVNKAGAPIKAVRVANAN